MSTETPLFTPLTVGRLTLKNRAVMAPMTRGRAASTGGAPTALMADYYRQRAEAGLIVTEATAISPQGVGWVNAPGIFAPEHVQGWRPVTAAVHEAGGRIFLQLWHMGRVSHPDFLGGALPVGPSAVAAAGESTTPNGKKPYVTPRALEAQELAGIAADYAAAAKNAIEAGFDGVEIHGANGYLLDQFIRDASNRREDEYGGSIEKRWRFPLEVARAVAAAVGPERTAIRLSTVSGYNGMGDSDPHASFAYGASQLDALSLAYVHVLEARPGHMLAVAGVAPVHPRIRAEFRGPLILNGGYDRAAADAAIAEGAADAVAFGVPFLANPDLLARFRQGAALNPPDFRTFYTPGAAGYTDYPALG
ncbi:MAG: alkene reductase [Myxococcales bacterium]|nr:alkene reductase [Myxococcales bacterium]